MQIAQQLRLGLTVGAVLLSSFAWQLPVHAQAVSEDQVKAAYLYNFAKFVEWPANAFSTPTAPVRLCVLNDAPFESELNRLVKAKTIASRRVDVVSVKNEDESRGCHLLFIGASRNVQFRPLMNALRNSTVLTVGETEGFLEDGGIINFVLQDDRIQFQVNHKGAKEAGLRISSRLLSVAKLVIE